MEYVCPALSKHSGDRARAAGRVPVGSATGYDDRGGVGVVPEGPTRDNIIHMAHTHIPNHTYSRALLQIPALIVGYCWVSLC